MSDGAVGRGIAPAGASRGSREAIDKRDGGARLGGFDVQERSQGIRTRDRVGSRRPRPVRSGGVDARLIALDGTPNKARLGGNALTAVSLAVLHAAAASRGVPLWRICLGDRPAIIPLPEIQIFGGGAHAGRRTDIQDFMVVAPRAETFAEALEVTAEVYPPPARSWPSAASCRASPTRAAGGRPSRATRRRSKRWCGRSSARGSFPERMLRYPSTSPRPNSATAAAIVSALEKRELDRDAMAEMLLAWCARYPIVSIEDPFARRR